MSIYERSETERGKGNRSTSTRIGVFKTISNSIIREATEKEAKERERLRNATQGNGKYIMNGSDDRINGKIYDADNKYSSLTQDDERSYFYGYTYHGSRRLYAVILELQKENKIEEIKSIGYRDYEHGIDEDHLGMLVQNEYYMEGYNSAKVKRSR